MLRDRLAEAVGRESRDLREEKRVPTRLRVPAVLAGLALLASALAIARLLGEQPPPDLSALRFTPFATEAPYEGLPSWSPDGQTIAYAAEVKGVLQIFTRRINSSTPAQVTTSRYDAKHPFWSHDGRRLYYVSPMRYAHGIWSVPAAG